MVSAAPASAQSQSSVAIKRPIPKPDRLCNYIFTKSKGVGADSFEYNYQNIIYNAAGISLDDFENLSISDEEINRRVGIVWQEQIAHLKCGPMGVPATGDPVQYAIHTAFWDFVTDAVNWGIDLNTPDKVVDLGGQTGTYLDFLDIRIARSSGDLRARLESIRQSFIKAGAKRASEL